ncbi:hypothetical protein [Kerstersia similis]|uniref:hypothetical protein n=1 Tax=Kerstersia similis TaxID=206505 RepID=UPI0039EE520E
MTVKSSFVPHLVASVCIGTTLAACVGGDGDSAWRSDNNGGPGDDTSGTQECNLTAAGDGLTLKICNLPTGSRLPILHTSGETQNTLAVEGSSADAQTLNVRAQGGDVLKLEPVIVGAPQQYLVQCAFTSYGNNGSLQKDGSLLLKEGFETATQTVRCGRVRLLRTQYAPGAGGPNIGYILRLNLDTAQAAWLRDSQGNQMTSKDFSLGAMSRFAGGKQILNFTDPVSGETGIGTTSGQDGDQQLLTFTARDGSKTRTHSEFWDIWQGGTLYSSSGFQRGSNPEWLHFSYRPYESWQTDGTDAGSQFSTVFEPEQDIVSYQVAGDQLWYTVRTEAADGKGVLSYYGKDLATGTITELPALAGVSFNTSWDNTIGGKLVYGKYTSSGKLYRLYSTDGTESGTQTLIDQVIASSANNAQLFTQFGNYLYFKFDKSQLWRTDGTPSGTEMVFDLKTYANYAQAEIADIAATDEFLAFSATIDNQSGFPIRALYRSDGTNHGTKFIANPATVMPNTRNDRGSGDSAKLFVVGNRIVFGDDASNYTRMTNHLWSTDGTEEGTVRLFPNAEVSFTYTAAECQLSCSTSGGIAVFNDRLLIRARNLLTTDTGDAYHVFFWVSDGTPDGTVAVSDTAGNRFSYASYY